MDSTHAKVIELLNEHNGKVLDAGAGTGSLTRELVKRFANVDACDVLPKSKFRCKCTYKQADLNKKWPYKNNSFDIVCMVEVIEHLENPWHAIREAKRVLEKGGTLVFTTPNIMNLLSRVTFLLRGRFFCFGPNEFKIKHHLNPITWYELKLILKQEELKVSKVTTNKRLSWKDLKKGMSMLLTLPLIPLIKPWNSILRTGEILVLKVEK